MRVRVARVQTAALLRFLNGSGKAVEGIAAVEFGIIVPVLLLLMLGTVEVGTGVYHKMQVHNAAQAGAQYASIKGFDKPAIKTAVTSATSFAGISADPEPVSFCGCPSATGVATVGCTAKCPDGLNAGAYVRVFAKGTYTTVVDYPGISLDRTFTAQSTVRIQ